MYRIKKRKRPPLEQQGSGVSVVREKKRTRRINSAAWVQRDSNPRPPGPEAGALPAELWTQWPALGACQQPFIPLPLYTEEIRPETSHNIILYQKIFFVNTTLQHLAYWRQIQSVFAHPYHIVMKTVAFSHSSLISFVAEGVGFLVSRRFISLRIAHNLFSSSSIAGRPRSDQWHSDRLQISQFSHENNKSSTQGTSFALLPEGVGFPPVNLLTQISSGPSLDIFAWSDYNRTNSDISAAFKSHTNSVNTLFSPS